MYDAPSTLSTEQLGNGTGVHSGMERHNGNQMRGTVPAAQTSLFCQDLKRQEELKFCSTNQEFKENMSLWEIKMHHVFLVPAELVGFVPSVHLPLLLPLLLGEGCHRHSPWETQGFIKMLCKIQHEVVNICVCAHVQRLMWLLYWGNLVVFSLYKTRIAKECLNSLQYKTINVSNKLILDFLRPLWM